jgi:hypothetical protein
MYPHLNIVTHPLVHIKQKREIALEIAKCKRALKLLPRFHFVRYREKVIVKLNNREVKTQLLSHSLHLSHDLDTE